MGRRHLAAGLMSVIALFVCSCTAPQTASGPHPWTDAPVLDDAGRFHFAIFADLTGGERPGVFDEAVPKMALLQPPFVMCVGDLIEGYTEEPEEIARQREVFMKRLDALDMRVYLVPGNHDIANTAMADEWRTRYGPAYYDFVYRDVLFLCLNTEDPPRTHIGDEQAQYVARVLAEHPDVRWTFVFMHEPLWLEADGGAATGWTPVAQALEGRPHTVFAGHFHHYIHSLRDGRDHIVLATTGGTSSLRGDAFGEFDQLVWVTMTEDGPVIANLKIDGILPKDIVSEEMNDMRRALAGGTCVRSDGLVSEERMLERASGTVALHNGHRWPITVRGEFAECPGIAVEPASFEEELAPGASRKVAVTATAEQPIDLTELAPLALHVTAACRPEGRDPVAVPWDCALSVYGAGYGREIALNGAFGGTGEPWLPWVQPAFGSVAIADGEVRVEVKEPPHYWSAGIRQFVEGMRPGARYRLSLKAANEGGPGAVHFLLKAGQEQETVQLLIGGRWEGHAVIPVGSAMEDHVVEFTTPRDVDLTRAKLSVNFGDLREARIQSLSLRELVGVPAPETATTQAP